MILVTGCPRSGTYYAALLFQAHGVDIRHEHMGTAGTSDWRLAGARADVVLHQVRHPLAVIGSLHTIKLEAWQRFNAVVPLPEPLLERCAAAWLLWTALSDRGCDLRYRVEDVGEHWAELQALVPELTPFEDCVPHDANPRPHPDVTWDDIARLPQLGPAVIARAKIYGYEVSL